MPSFGHVAVGLAGGRLAGGDGARLRAALVFTGLAWFPDLDVLGWFLHVDRASAWAHRGATHSLLAAALAAVLGALLLDRGRGFLATFALAFAAAASHGLLDTITRGGSGVMLLWPFSPDRFLAPWHPLPAAPLGPRIFSPRGLTLMAGEAVAFSPFLACALWPRRGSRVVPAQGKLAT